MNRSPVSVTNRNKKKKEKREINNSVFSQEWLGFSTRMHELTPTRTFKMLFVLSIFMWNFEEGIYGLPGEQTHVCLFFFLSFYHRLAVQL